MSVPILWQTIVRFIYQIVSFSFIILAGRYFPSLDSYIALRPITSFIVSASSLNLDGGFIRQEATGERFVSGFFLLTSLKLILIPSIGFLLSLALWLTGTIKASFLTFSGCLLLAIIFFLCSTNQSIFVRLNKDLQFLTVFFLPLSLFFPFIFLLLSFIARAYGQSLVLPTFILSFTLFLLAILVVSLNLVGYRFSFPVFPFFRAILAPAFASYLISQSANLIELLPFIIASKNLGVAGSANLSITIQFYFSFLVSPFLILLKRFIVTGEMNTKSLGFVFSSVFLKAKLYPFFVLGLFILYIISFRSGFLSYYSPLLLSFALVSLLFPFTLARLIVSYKLLSSQISPFLPMFIFLLIAFTFSALSLFYQIHNLFFLIVFLEFAYIFSALYALNSSLRSPD